MPKKTTANRGTKRKFVEPVITYFNIDGQKEYLNYRDAERKFGLELWTNSIIPTDSTTESAEIRANIHNDLLSSVHLQAKMAVKEIEVNGQRMHGLIATKKIHAGESIIYGSKQYGMDYAEISQDDLYKLQVNDTKVISAERYGNMARFMNHALDEDEVASLLEFTSEEAKNSLATANFKSKLRRENDFEYMVLTALEDIEPGSTLYWNYTIEYFEHIPIQIALFNQEGSVISPENYTWKNRKPVLKVLDEDILINDISLDEVLNNDGLIEVGIQHHQPCFYLVIHAQYIRNILQNNPVLADNYYVRIPEIDFDNPLVKVFDEYSNKTGRIISNYIKNTLDTTTSDATVSINSKLFLDNESTPGKFSRKYVVFHSITGPEENLQAIITSCIDDNIKHIYADAENTLYIFAEDIFTRILTVNLHDLQVNDGMRTPPRGESIRRFNMFQPINTQQQAFIQQPNAGADEDGGEVHVNVANIA